MLFKGFKGIFEVFSLNGGLINILRVYLLEEYFGIKNNAGKPLTATGCLEEFRGSFFRAKNRLFISKHDIKLFDTIAEAAFDMMVFTVNIRGYSTTYSD